VAASRWFVRCTTCLAVSAVNESPNTAEWKCGICGGHLECMGRVERERLVAEHLQSVCDDRCTFARGPVCNCKCGGEHHGSKRVVRVVRDLGPVPTVTPSAGREQARLNADEYRSYRAGLLAELDGLLVAKRNGYLPAVDYNRMRALQQANARAAEARDHRARMRTLRAVVGPLSVKTENPIRELAQAINEAPAISDVPFSLSATSAPTRQPKQTTLF
jgi:hypothetical protein